MALGVTMVGAVLIGWIALLGLLLVWLWVRGSRAQAVEGWSSGEFDERRHGSDRRLRDHGPPPGVGERRSGFERRRRGLSVARP